MPTNPANHPNSPPAKGSGLSSTTRPDGAILETAPFLSILFSSLDDEGQLEEQGAPDFFPDLNLDQIVDTVTAGREEYHLKPFFYRPLERVEAVRYRQAVFQDFEDPKLLRIVRSFAEEMRNMRAHLARSEKHHYKLQKQASFLDAVETYWKATVTLAQELACAKPDSRGFQRLSDFLAGYCASEEFAVLRGETEKIRANLEGVRYSLHIHGARVTVDRNDRDGDYSQEVLEAFQKFRQADPRSHRLKMPLSIEMNHIEAQILDLVAKLHSGIFAHLDEYCTRYRGYFHEVIAKFDREVQFYIAYLEQMDQVRKAGLAFCYPNVTNPSKEIQALETYDLALANQLIRAHKDVVTNGFYLTEPERIFVVSGPNQGGKTTFARTFGQVHYLAALGCPVPGASARLFLFDRIFTHFEKEEKVQNLRGKLEDELIRINEILQMATANSILIMNESFLSTTMNDALFLSREVMKRIADLNLLCVTVTFLDELSSFSGMTVSMVSTVNPIDPQQRTFKVIRRPADGLAYATAIAEKYRLTYDAVKMRVGAEQSEVRRS